LLEFKSFGIRQSSPSPQKPSLFFSSSLAC
jgi:hypothetical protein